MCWTCPQAADTMPHPRLRRWQVQKYQQQQQAKRDEELRQRILEEHQKKEERRQLEEDGILGVGGGQQNADVLEEQTKAEEDNHDKQPVFTNYKPMKVKLGNDHPELIVESCAMASVEPPDAHYRPALPASLQSGERGFSNRAE
eukprot:4138515-Prymnesium_polylepis.1